MKKYKGIIFDLDGTLINTIEDLGDSVNEVLKSYEYPIHPYEAYKLKIGGGFQSLIENSFPKDTKEETIREALQSFVKIYDTKYQNKSQPYEGIEKILDILVQKGYILAVNSNKRTDYTNRLVEKLFPKIPFVEVFGERKDIPKKPDPVSALELADLMKLDPKDILYIGDTKTDMETAKNAGMDSVGVLWGFRGEEELRKSGARYIVSKPQEIIEIVEVD